MESVKYFDLAKEAIGSEALEKLKSKPRGLEWLRQYCSLVDSFKASFKGDKLEVAFDEESGMLALSLECGEVIVEQTEHPFYNLMETAKGCRISCVKDNPDRMKFVFKFQI